MRAYFLPAEMTYRCSRVVEQEAVELEILDLVCKVIKLAFFKNIYIYLLKKYLFCKLARQLGFDLEILHGHPAESQTQQLPLHDQEVGMIPGRIKAVCFLFFFFLIIHPPRTAPRPLWSPPSAGRTVSCCSTPSPSASASWRSLSSRGSLTRPNRAWVSKGATS